jgi:type I restriction enzyme, S subunit
MAGEWRTATVMELQREGILLVEDGNHGEYRPRPDEFVESGVAFIRAADMDAGRVLFDSAAKINDRARQRITKGVGAPGDVLLSHKGTVGKVARVPADAPDFVCSPQTTFWRTRDERRLDRAYLYAFLRSATFGAQLATRAGETDMAPYVSLTSQRGLSVTLPPLREQRAISHILGTLDDKIEMNRRMSETLEAMARALFKSWFVDFDPVRAKAEGRDPGVPKPLADLFPARLVDSELGEIPEGWGVVALGALIATVKGRSYKSEELVESDTALVTLKSFARGGGYRPDGLKSFAGTYKPEQIVRPGELVIACTDVTQAAEVIGRPAIVRGTGHYQRLVASLDTLIVRPRDSSMTRSFLYFLGGTEAFVAHTFAHTTGTTVLHLAKEAVPSFSFARPSTPLVKQFDALAGSALDRVQALDEEAGTLTQLRDALLPRLISGELRVADAASMAEAVT